MLSWGLSLALTRGSSNSRALVRVLMRAFCVRAWVGAYLCAGVVTRLSDSGLVNLLEVCLVVLVGGLGAIVARSGGACSGLGASGGGLHSGSGSSPSALSKSPWMISGVEASLRKTTCGVTS